MDPKANLADLPDVPASAAGLASKCLQEFVQAWERGERPRAAVWLKEHGELSTDKSFVLDLAYEEYCQRSEKDGHVDAEEFCDQFPEHRESVAKLLSVHAALGLTDAPATKLAPWPEVGDELLGFKLCEPLGRGTFARVFLAEDLQLGRQVVVKICRDGQAEATTLARLDHPHIVPIHSAPSDPFLGFTAICLPFQGEVTLAQAIAERRQAKPGELNASTLRDMAGSSTVRPSRASTLWRAWGAESFETAVIRLGLELASGLMHAHEAGVIHRDLKPSNVLLGFDGRGRLMDFNLAADRQLSARIAGTLPYMAPEQLTSLVCSESKTAEKPDPQSDIFSLGVLLYELATGKHPFGNFSTPDKQVELSNEARSLLERQRTGAPAATDRLGGITPRLDAVLRRCLAFDRQDRFASADELRAALVRELSPLGRLTRWAQRRPLTATITTLLFVAIVAAATWAAAAMTAMTLPDEAAAGRLAFQAGRYELAEKHLMTAVLQHEEDHELRLMLGISRMKQGEYELALQDFLRLYKDAPTVASAELGAYCSLMQKEGTSLGRELLEGAPGSLSPESSNNLAYCLLQSYGGQEQAKPLLDYAVDLLPERQAPYVNRIRWAWVASAKEPTEIAALESDIARAIEIGPDCSELRMIITFALGHPTRKKEIPPTLLIEHLRRAMELGQNHESILADPLVAPYYMQAKPHKPASASDAATPGIETFLEPPLPAIVDPAGTH
jgi:serine/threonine protein kinase